jgi:hypothetical protein
MSLDIYLTATRPTTVYEGNVTHNLNRIASKAGIYKHLWRPEELGITKAGDLIAPLAKAVALMKAEPARFIALNPPNGWGSYEHFVPWLEKYLAACAEYPDANIHVSR